MSPQGGDDPSSPDSSRAGGLANVFRGLTTSKSNRSLPLSSSSSSVALPVTELVNATPAGMSTFQPNALPPGALPPGTLPPAAMESFERLKNGNLNERIAAANHLKYALPEYPLNPVLDFWHTAIDLIDPSNPPAARTAGWELLTECAKHDISSDLERKEYFETLTAPAHPDDFHLQLAAVVDLSRGGRRLSGFDYDIPPVLITWLQEAYRSVRNARKVAAAKAAKNSSSKSSAKNKTVALGEEKNLTQLFSFVIDVIKFSFKCFDDAAIHGLIDAILNICMSTSVEEDLQCCINVFNTLVTYGWIPDDQLKGCIQVLSSIFCLVPSLQKESWHALANFFKSHNGQAAVRILLDVLRGLPPEAEAEAEAEKDKDKDMGREIRSTVAVLQKLLSKTAQKGYPGVPFRLLSDGLCMAVKATSSTRVYVSLLQIINYLFSAQEGGPHRIMIDEDWTAILGVAADCAGKPAGGAEDQSMQFLKTDSSDDPIGTEMRLLINRLNEIITNRTGKFIPRKSVIGFFAKVFYLLPDSAACTVLDYFKEFRACSPSYIGWEENLTLVLDGFFNNRNRSSETRLRALHTTMDAYEILDLIFEDDEEGSIANLARSILKNIVEESDVHVLDAVMSLMVSVVTSCDMNLFDHIISTLRGIIDNDLLRSPISPPVLSASTPSPGDEKSPEMVSQQSPSDVVTKGYIKMFARVMNQDGAKTVKLFNVLVYIARLNHCEVDARLSAMKMLFRLRADWANRIFLTTVMETNFLGTALCRTEESLAKKQAEEAANALRMSRAEQGALTRSSRSFSTSHSQASDKTAAPARATNTTTAGAVKGINTGRYHQLWKVPDPDALPPEVPNLISPILTSCEAGIDESAGDVANEEKESDSKQVYVLDMHLWLESILSILRGSDWEVYSFVLVHLPSQLSNHGIFKGAIKQIQDLRKLICEHVRTNGFQEPPNASGLRRADVAICLFHSLTMILSYHDHFQKAEEDDIVKTYVHGIRAWERTAQCCIHALSICCHELPLSTSKSLGQMLNQMAAIITQPNVAIHILEFLASLSRLYDVYVNFRDDEYRTVFGICFRYLDYAKDKRRSIRTSYASEASTPSGSTQGGPDLSHPNASDDLPQYVYALAYHVMFFWFLALKLPDRAHHVGTIMKRVLVDVDGSGTFQEEQALIALDFLQRMTYADVGESREDPMFDDPDLGNSTTKRWLVGNSMITVKQSLATGMAQVTKRQASGTSVYMVRELLQPPPLHQARVNVDMGRDGKEASNTILPSHLMVQLMSPLPHSSEMSRPIPMPSDDATDRALRVFDRIPSVDGHKVGVIYIGEGQTDERDILANVSGSSDYVEFLKHLGTLTRLKGAKFNTQGLDHEMDIDGEYTFCWRDRLTEIIFHVTTQMPTNLDHDPQVSNKKRHIGNDFVNIIFNDSGLPFNFNTFPSEFNYVYIVVTPASRASFIATREAENNKEKAKEQPFYRVQVMSKAGFPEISPASETKIVSLTALPQFIRLIALNASVFSMVWQHRAGGEHVSTWRSRLREIKRLREKYGPKRPGSSQQQQAHSGHGTIPFSGGSMSQQSQQAESRPASSMRESFTSLRRTSVATFFTSTSEQTSHRSSLLSGPPSTNDTEVGGGSPQGVESTTDTMDFSKWA